MNVRGRSVARALACTVLALAGGVADEAPAATLHTCVGADGHKTYSDRPCPTSSAEAGRRPVPAAPSSPGAARHGLSFALVPLADGGIDARCEAGPAPVDRPLNGGCDAQRGDTVCARALPVLCFKPGERRERAPAVVDVTSGRVTPPAAPAEAQLGASPAVRGDRLASQQEGSAACQRALGPGWAMASLQDGATWRPRAARHDSLAAVSGRLWVANLEAGGNCWNAPATPAPSLPVAADERRIVDEILKMRSSPEYARLPPRCRQRYDEVARALQANRGGALVTEGSVDGLLAWMEACGPALTAPAPPR